MERFMLTWIAVFSVFCIRICQPSFICGNSRKCLCNIDGSDVVTADCRSLRLRKFPRFSPSLKAMLGVVDIRDNPDMDCQDVEKASWEKNAPILHTDCFALNDDDDDDVDDDGNGDDDDGDGQDTNNEHDVTYGPLSATHVEHDEASPDNDDNDNDDDDDDDDVIFIALSSSNLTISSAGVVIIVVVIMYARKVVFRAEGNLVNAIGVQGRRLEDMGREIRGAVTAVGLATALNKRATASLANAAGGGRGQPSGSGKTPGGKVKTAGRGQASSSVNAPGDNPSTPTMSRGRGHGTRPATRSTDETAT